MALFPVVRLRRKFGAAWKPRETIVLYPFDFRLSVIKKENRFSFLFGRKPPKTENQTPIELKIHRIRVFLLHISPTTFRHFVAVPIHMRRGGGKPIPSDKCTVQRGRFQTQQIGQNLGLKTLECLTTKKFPQMETDVLKALQKQTGEGGYAGQVLV